MKKKAVWILAGAFWVASSAWAGGPLPESPGLIAKGRSAYSTNCVLCHGDRADGSGPAASSLSPRPRNLLRDAFTRGASPQDIFNTISRGISGTPMPGFDQLSEDERWGLVYFIRSLRRG